MGRPTGQGTANPRPGSAWTAPQRSGLPLGLVESLLTVSASSHRPAPRRRARSERREPVAGGQTCGSPCCSPHRRLHSARAAAGLSARASWDHSSSRHHVQPHHAGAGGSYRGKDAGRGSPLAAYADRRPRPCPSIRGRRHSQPVRRTAERPPTGDLAAALIAGLDGSPSPTSNDAATDFHRLDEHVFADAARQAVAMLFIAGGGCPRSSPVGAGDCGAGRAAAGQVSSGTVVLRRTTVVPLRAKLPSRVSLRSCAAPSCRAALPYQSARLWW